MANSTGLNPVPYSSQVVTPRGLLSVPWQAFFKQLYQVVLTASQINATTAAQEAQTAATNAASSASAASSSQSSASTYATQAATSASSAANSATQAASSATSAANYASQVQAQIDLVGAQAYSPDYISDTVQIPVHRQLITFQRVTITLAGSLQISGRGRIL